MVVHMIVLHLQWTSVKLNTVSIVSMTTDVYLKNKKLWLIYLHVLLLSQNFHWAPSWQWQIPYIINRNNRSYL